MNDEPKLGMGFVPIRGRIDQAPNPAPAPVVNNFYIAVDPKAAEAVRDALFMALVFVLALILLKYGPKLLEA
jgi:hypothetical protein